MSQDETNLLYEQRRELLAYIEALRKHIDNAHHALLNDDVPAAKTWLRHARWLPMKPIPQAVHYRQETA